MALEFADLVVLTKRREDNSLDINSREIFIDPQSRVRLEQAGIIDSKGRLTEAGISFADNLDAKIEVLKGGIHFEQRKTKTDFETFFSDNEWFTGTVSKKDVVTNGAALFVEKAIKRMEAQKASGDFRKKLPNLFANWAKEKTVLVYPHTYQVEKFGVLDIIWLADKEQKLFVPIQSTFFDYVRFRFPKGAFHATHEGGPVFVKIKNKGIKGIISVIMPLAADKKIKVPEGREEWLNGEDGEEV